MKRAIRFTIAASLLATAAIAHSNKSDKKEVLSLSGGKYVETFDQDSIELIGPVLYNVNSRKIIAFVKADDSEEAASVKPEVISRWMSVDPLAAKYPGISPYVFCNDNPIKNIDADGRKFLDFNEAGDFVGVSHDNWFHNLFFRQGRILNSDGDAVRRFRFADRDNDVKDIESGVINHLVTVTEAQLKTMVAWSGGFDHENKVENRSATDRYGYIKHAGIGGGKMDFSYTQIPKMFPGASIDPLHHPSSMIFLPPAVNTTEASIAHNQMNFGNYLFGLSGEAQGFSGLELSAGAHYNSIVNEGTNGYPGQLDSNDDQFSIQQGYNFGLQRGWDKVEYKVESGQLQLVDPNKNNPRVTGQ